MLTKKHVAYCGQIRGIEIFQQAMQPALRLREQGLIDEIILSTWYGQLDAYPGGAGALRAQGIHVIESSFPQRLAVMGNVFQQILSLDRALDIIDDDDFLLKTRPDVVFLETDALEAVIVRSVRMIEQDTRKDCANFCPEKIWIPFFVPLIPFFAADQIFFGRGKELRKFSCYDMFPEAYQTLDRRYGQDPGGRTAQEIRRFLAPFINRHPVLREYQFVWPKLALMTSVLPNVCHYNINSSFYREYLALWLQVVHENFVVGDVPEANGKVGIIRDAAHRGSTQLSLIEQDSLPDDLGSRLAIPGYGSPMPQVAFGASWLRKLIKNPGEDPLGDVMFREPLARSLAYKNDEQRREAFRIYLQGLWALADSSCVPFSKDD